MRQNPYRKGSNRVVGDVSLAAVQGEGIIRDRSARCRAPVPSVSSSRFSNRLNVSRKLPSLAIASPQRPPIRFFRECGNLCAASSFGFFYQADNAANRSSLGGSSRQTRWDEGIGRLRQSPSSSPKGSRASGAKLLRATLVAGRRVRRSLSWWWFRRCEPPGNHSARSPWRFGREPGRRGSDRHR